MAGALALAGCRVRLWNRDGGRLHAVRQSGCIRLQGAVQGAGVVECCTEDLGIAIRGAALIFVVTTADAHEVLAEQLAPLVEDGQFVLLNPGRTCGAMAVRSVLDRLCPDKDVVVGEAQSLVFACRAEGATVRIIGAKDFVPVAACPGRDTARLLAAVQPLFPSFHAAETVLHTGFENIGAIFHPAIVLFNAAAIERGQSFYFYQDMTPRIARFLSALDEERIAAGAAYGIRLNSIFEWIQKAYPQTLGDTLCARLRTNPAYDEILAPESLSSRLLTEDLPTGLVPLHSLGTAVGVPMPLTRALVDLGGALLERDFWTEGRTLVSLGLGGLGPAQILEHLR
jgi:opine dehydrogenase